MTTRHDAAVGKLLATTPPDLRWAADQFILSDDGSKVTRGRVIAALADRVEAAISEDGPATAAVRHELLVAVAPELRWTAEVLAESTVRDVVHRSNNLLQAAENADFILSRMAETA